MKNRVCPICGKVYNEYPAISRKDNKTEICSGCGIAEAFEGLEVSLKECIEILREDENGKESD